MNKRRKNNTCINERKHEGNERINERGYSEYEAQWSRKKELKQCNMQVKK